MSRQQSAAFVSIQGAVLTPEEKAVIKDISPIGFTLFKRNIENKIQLKRLTEDIKNTLEREDILFGTDQEGGRVRRLTEPEFPSYASQETLGRLYEEVSPQAAQTATKLHASLIAHDLRECGLNLNFAPVLDLQYPYTAPVLKSRCFSSSKAITAELGKIMVEEYINQGIIPCIKHLPGHGRIQSDPHLTTPKITASLKDLTQDFYPFQKLAPFTPFGMSAHIIIEQIDLHHPLTQSSEGIQKIIRDLIGFNGFLISDSITMNALHGSLIERAQATLSAGCDAYCYCDGELSDLKILASFPQELSPQTQHRLDEAKRILQNTPQFSANYKDYQSLIGQIEAYKDTYDSTTVLERMKQLSKNEQ